MEYSRLTGWDKGNAYVRECFERTPELGGCEDMSTSRCEWCEASLEIVRRLAQYEDSGLSPEQVAEFVHKGLPAALDKLAEYESTGLQPGQVMALVEEDEPLFIANTCRVCGCTDDMACPGGCWWVEPDLCSRCAEVITRESDTKSEPTLVPMNYIHENGQEIFVWRNGQEQYGTFWRSASGGMHRIKSPAMPMTFTKKEAQANLDAWAEKKGLPLVEVSDQCKTT